MDGGRVDGGGRKWTERSGGGKKKSRCDESSRYFYFGLGSLSQTRNSQAFYDFTTVSEIPIANGHWPSPPLFFQLLSMTQLEHIRVCVCVCVTLWSVIRGVLLGRTVRCFEADVGRKKL